MICVLDYIVDSLSFQVDRESEALIFFKFREGESDKKYN